MQSTIVCDRLQRCGRPIHDRASLCLAAGLALAALMLSVPGQVLGQVQPSPLKIVGPAKLTLDPVCNARNGVSLGQPLLLRNDGSKEVQLALSAAEPASKTAGKVAVTKVAITPLDANGRAATEKIFLAPGKQVGVRVDLTGILDSGEWEIELRNGGTPVGALTVANPQVGFRVKLDVATPDNPELTFERGKPATIALKNEDGVDYRVSGQYSVRGIVQDDTQEVSLSANGGGELRLTPLDDWFAPWVRTLFKDDVADGRLTLRFASNACLYDPAAPTRVFKVKTTLAPWPADVKDRNGNLVLLAVLILGGVCSLALNLLLPAHGQRLRARMQLSLAARRIDDITIETDSRVRNSIAVERRQLAERLQRLKLLDGQFSSEMTEIERGLTRLGTRLDLLGHMQLVLNRYWRRRSVIVSDDIEELRLQLFDLLRRSDPSDSDIQAAQSLINKINEHLTGANAANPDVSARLAKKIGILQKEFDPTTGPIGTSPVWKNLCTELAEEFDKAVETAPTDPDKIAPADYVRFGQAVFILEQVSTFIKLCKAANPAGTLAPEEKKRLDRLLGHLRAGGWDQLKRAERLIRQIRQNIFYEQIETEIKGERVTIERNRPVVRQFEPTELRVMFLNKQVNGSAVREEYTCNWEFGYANLKATGWSVSHFFPSATEPEPQGPEPQGLEPERGLLRKLLEWLLSKSSRDPDPKGSKKPAVAGKAYRVNVKFVRDDGEKVLGVVTDEIHVWPPLGVKMRASIWTEWLRLGLALGIATVGLMAGAREQILKLDVFPALIAVFLLGFGSDRIKNLFTQRPPSAEEPKPPRVG